jgi:hypothetical protein
MKPKDCTCTGVCLQIPDGSCQRLNKSMYSGSDKVPQFIYSEPKADPKEKELYSIKPLEWMAYAAGFTSNPLSLFHYTVWLDARGYYWSINHAIDWPCKDFDDGKRQAQDHFNSKLKLCLNREL